MARKPWDALTDDYRNRLTRRGISEEQHRTGVPLHTARGHKNPLTETWMRRTAKFARDYVKATWQPPERVSVVRSYVRTLGMARGKKYMDESMKNIRLYEGGNTDAAHDLWDVRKDDTVIDYLYYYHGIFN